jgi:hypothetical protein
MTRPAKLTIALANGFALELSDSYPSPSTLTGMARVQLLIAHDGGRRLDPLCTVFVASWDTFNVARDSAGGDTWTLCCGHTHLDLDSAEQARAAADWLDAYFAAYTDQRNAAYDDQRPSAQQVAA